MIFNMTGGGGASLNFKVVAYATEEALLAAALAENSICIITTTGMTGWAFSNTEPESPAEGMVWIRTSEASSVPFNALKKNTVTVYPLTAEQYIDGAWKSVTGKIYQDGALTDFWDGGLYDSGNEYAGWSLVPMGANADTPASTTEVVVTKDASSMTIEIPSDGVYKAGCAYVYDEYVDLTNFDTLVFDGTFYTIQQSTQQSVSLNIWSELGTYISDNLVSQKKYGNLDWNIDVSSLVGKYRIGFWVWSASSKITVNKLRLE